VVTDRTFRDGQRLEPPTDAAGEPENTAREERNERSCGIGYSRSFELLLRPLPHLITWFALRDTSGDLYANQHRHCLGDPLMEEVSCVQVVEHLILHVLVQVVVRNS
jgi:hypothetical protein